MQALGVAASNDPLVAEQLLEATGLSGDAQVTVKDQTMSLAAALASRFEITSASPRFLEQWASRTKAAEPAFKKVWDNPDDAAYDGL